MYLDTLCHTLAHLHIVLAAHVFLYVGGEVVTGNTDGVVAYDTSERDDCNLGRTTTDIHNHIALGSLNINTNTDSSSHWFEDKINVTSIGMLGRVANGTQLHLGRA